MLDPGQDFAHFKIIRLLGEGGMGQVYLAEDQKLHRQVALKILTWSHGDDSERLARFEREARTAAQISHPHVMAIYDINETVDVAGAKVLYIVMEYIKGKPLGEYLKSRQIDTATAVRLSEKIAAGLAAAHKMNVVHRDIKADNIMVDDDDQPKILDFGLAKPVDPLQFSGETGTKTISKELTRTGKIIGTVSYMSPEQVRGEQVDTRSDIFSFGVLLYRMATGEQPFAGPTEVSTLAKILEARHESPRIKNDTIPPELERIIDKCLQKDPNDRYQDSRDLVVDLRNLRRQYESGVTDRITGEISRQTASRPRSKFARRPAMLIAAALLMIFVVALKYFDKSEIGGSNEVLARPNSLAILDFENQTGNPEYDWLQTGLPEMLLTDLSQHAGMNLISRQRILATLETNRPGEQSISSDMKRSIAQELGATNLLTGTLFKMGDKIRIDARLEEAGSGRVLMGEKVIGDDPFALVDSLTDKIAASMNVVHTSGSEQDIRNLTSSSPEAYKQYVLGMEKFGYGLYDEAIRYFERAISFDSTFALPYMRIGMAHAFQNHPQEASRYLALASRYQSKLPTRERTLLDIYADLWLNKRFDDAFTKMRTMVNNYPDDIEARCIYGVLLLEFTRDSVKSFAQLDTVLSLNPTYQLAKEFRAQTYLNYGMYDEAIRLSEEIKKEHPESPSGYVLLGTVYLRDGKRDKAEKEFADVFARYPSYESALSSLLRLSIYRRDFEQARQYVEKYNQLEPGNLYNRVDYHDQMASVLQWEGKFKDALRQYDLMVQTAEQLGDSNILANSYQSTAGSYINFGFVDTGLALYRQAHAYSTANLFSNYTLVLVEHDHTLADSLRPNFQRDIKAFKSRIPAELWGITDGLEQIFEGHAKLDSNLLLDGYRTLIKTQGRRLTGNHREMAYLLINRGQYQEGIDILKRYISGEEESSGGYGYPMALYYLGIGYEGLGDLDEAKKCFSQMLTYWDNADIQISEIVDARSRLARLTS